ncbi:MAG: Glu-tRNA(Gln) amidotransferase subunit GatE [Candidatus Heimdallarchaeota archaeon]|nr:Glu-tRNA(Gln) amidotransferase subunit GatE [Candidatus Heimdallarchaeota archaeon]
MPAELDNKAPTEFDFKKEGLMVGLEFHQQIDAPYDDTKLSQRYGSKLFCPCPAYLREDEPHYRVRRKFRAVSGETGDIDITAQFEKNKQNETIYEGYHDTTCLIELDEEPILPINAEALFRTLAIAKQLFNLVLVDEILINRKTIIDGSNTSGFQRTAQVAYGSDSSLIDVNGHLISIYQANLEEDSAKNSGTAGNIRKFRLDRLGIPLIEIATGPDIRSPEETLATASRIGELLRTTGFVKRGQGTIRQDLNVSIKRGTRIEIKGVSELDLLPKYVTNEATRQFRMLQFVDELRIRKITPRKIYGLKAHNLTAIFKKTDAKFVKSSLKKGGSVVGVKLPNMKGLLSFELQVDYRVGTEMSEIAKVTAGVGGILHSDELPKYGISENEVIAVNKALKLKDADAFILVIADKNLAFLAVEGIKYTMKMWIESESLIPEVRAPRGDGTTGFLRPLPGKARMYPETDAKPVVLTKSLRQKIDQVEFEMPEQRMKRYQTKFKLSKDLADQLSLHPQNALFEELVTNHEVSAILVATTLLSTIVDLRRQGYEVEKITPDNLNKIFSLISSSEITSDAIEPILIKVSESVGELLIDTSLIESLGLTAVDPSELESTVKQVCDENSELIQERGMGAMGSLMRLVMDQLGGKADGKTVSQLVRKQIQAVSK